MTARKTRPKKGGPLPPGSSERDVAAWVGMSRREVWEAKLIASIPEEEFEALIESDKPPTLTQLVNVARRRAGLSTDRIRRCPHCGGKL